jgi:hypothetical protein
MEYSDDDWVDRASAGAGSSNRPNLLERLDIFLDGDRGAVAQMVVQAARPGVKALRNICGIRRISPP